MSEVTTHEAEETSNNSNSQTPNQELGKKVNNDTHDNFMEDPNVPDTLKEYIRKLRGENAESRTKLKEVSGKLNEYETAITSEREKKLAEAGEYQKLYQDAKTKLEQTEAKVKLADELTTIVQTMVDTELKALPKNIIKLMPKDLTIVQQLAWVNDAKEVQSELGTTDKEKKTNNSSNNSGNRMGPPPKVTTPLEEQKTMYELERSKRSRGNSYSI